jgi:hypothetical protein
MYHFSLINYDYSPLKKREDFYTFDYKVETLDEVKRLKKENVKWLKDCMTKVEDKNDKHWISILIDFVEEQIPQEVTV